ncbi:MAG: heme exporter protein CcmD [Devosia sp.]|nr:heme exporter protein CcmD [Devosia sp.]
MIELGQHAQFIIWAYVGVFAGLLALVSWTLLDARRTQRRLEALGDPRRDGKS